jgi:hypothetical protein
VKNDIHSDPLPDAIVQEFWRQAVNDVCLRLIEGSRASGVSLSAQECKTLLAAVRPKPKRSRGHPAVNWESQYRIALTCITYQWHGHLLTTEAVAATAKHLKISPNTVWNALKVFRSK